MKNSKGAKRSASKKARSIRLFLCAFLLVAMILPFVPEGALHVDALNSTFGPVESATTDSNGLYITGKPAVYIVGDGYAITWVTSFNGIGWVTYTKNGVEVSVYDERNGILRTNDTIHTVKIPEEDYQYLCNEYTVHSKKVISHSFEKTTYGEECSYTTKLKNTKPTGNTEANILVLTDVHGVATRAKQSFGQYDVFLGVDSDPDIVAFTGDVVDKIENQDALESVFEIIGNATLGQYPVVYCRGNHETRGYYATKLLDYFPTKTGEFYYDFTFGNLWGVVVDTGEDKPDEHYEYGFLANYKEYLIKQEAWLLSLRKPTDSSIKYRLGIYHIPSLEYLARRMYFNNTTEKKIENFFAGTNISDAMAHLDLQFAISGHEHKFQISDHSIKVSCEMAGKTEAEVEQYMVGAIYKQETVVNDLPAYEHGYADTFTKSGASLSFVKSSLVHKTFIAGGDGGGTGFVKLSSSKGNATIYALDNNANDAKVDNDGTVKTDGSGTVFSNRSNPRTVDFGAERNLSVSSAKTAEKGTFVHFTPLNPVWAVNRNKTSANDWVLTSRNYVSAGTAGSGISISITPAVLESGGDWYNVVWMTNIESAGYVQLTYNGKTYQFFDEVGGYRRSNDTIHTVKVPKEYLNNNKYFIGSFSIKYDKGYTFDKYCTSSEYLFEDRSNDKTPNIFLYSNYKNEDSHRELPNTFAQKVREGLSTDYSLIVANGDLLFSDTGTTTDNRDNFNHLFEALSKLSEGKKLVVFSRGNAECRGFYATELIKYLPTSTGEFYYTFNYGDYTFVNIDTAEDKVQNYSNYQGRVKTDGLYKRENTWLNTVLADTNNVLKENIAVISHEAIYGLDFKNDTADIDFSYLNLDWGKKLRQKGALINLAGGLIVPSIKDGEASERFLFTVFNGGYNYRNALGTYDSYSTGATVLLAEKYAYITFCQIGEKDGSYSSPKYDDYGNSKNIDDELGDGQKAYSLVTSEEIHYQPCEPPSVVENGKTKYILSQPSHVAWLSYMVNTPKDVFDPTNPNEYRHFEDTTFILANDIDMMLYPFTPIGGYENPNNDNDYRNDVYTGQDLGNGKVLKYFAGTFDGNGYKIKNLHILPEEKYDSYYLNNQVGLFGVVRNGHIKNLTVEGGFIKGGWNTGTIAGYVDSTTTTPATLTNCYSNVTVYGPGGTGGGASKVGGLIGNITYYVTVDKCANFGNVITTRADGSVGGLIGATYCYNANGTSNGTTGQGYQYIGNSFNRGTVYSHGSGQTVGGLVGYFARAHAKMENCYNASYVIFGDKKGQICGMVNRTNNCTLEIANSYYSTEYGGADRFYGFFEGFAGNSTYKHIFNGTTVTSSHTKNNFISIFNGKFTKSPSEMKTAAFANTLNSSAYKFPTETTGIKYNNGYPVHKDAFYAPNSVDTVVKETASNNVNQQFGIENGAKNLTDLDQMKANQSMYVLIANGNNFLVYDSVFKTSTLTNAASSNSKVNTFVWKLTKTSSGYTFVSVNGSTTLNVNDISTWTLKKSSGDNKYKIYSGSQYLTSTGTSVSAGSTQTQWYIFPILQDMDNSVTFGFSGRSSWTTGGTENMGIASTITSLSRAEEHRVTEDYGKFEAYYDSVFGTNIAPGTDYGWKAMYDYGVFRSEVKMDSAMVVPEETDQLMRMRCTYGDNNYMLWSISPRIQTSDQTVSQGTVGADNYVYHLTLTYGKDDASAPLEFRTDAPSTDGTKNTKYKAAQNFFVVYSLNEDGGYYIIPLNATETLQTIGVSTDKTSLDIGSFDSASEDRFWIQADKREIKAEVVDVLVEVTEVGGKAEFEIIEEITESRFSTTVKFGSAFYMADEKGKVEFVKDAYPGYTYVCDSAKVATYEDRVCYRYFRPNVYNVTFNSSLKNDSETIQLEYTEKLSDAIAQWKLKNSFTVSFDTNGGSGVSSKTYTWDVSSFTASSNQYSVNSEDEKMQNIAALFGVVKTDKANISAITVNWKDNPLNLSDVTKPTRDNYAFYGWSSNSAIGSESGIQTTLSNVKNDTTVYAYWAGADYKEVSEKRASTLSVVPKVYGATEMFTLGSGYTVEWYRVGPFDANGAFIKTADSYGVSADDKGKILKAVFKYNGVTVSSAYSAYLPGDVLVDANADDSTEEKAFVKVTSSETVPAESTVYVLYGGGTEIISGAINKTGLKFKVYGVIDDGNGTEVFLFDDTKPYLTSYIGAENGGVSYQGTSFIKVRVYFTNDTNNSITVNSDNFFLTTNPKVYKATLNDNGFGGEIQYINGSDYVSGQRALDASENKYFYNGDFIRVIVNKLSDGEKLSAGSYLDVGGIRVYPTYTNGANITFSYMNEFEHLIKNEALSSIKIGGKDLTVTVNFKAADNVSGTNNINIGPLGAKTYDKNGIKKIRFGTVWYLDDVVSANKWYRGDEFGSYIIMFKNLLKTTQNNDFYNYLVATYGQTKADSIKTTWDNYASDVNKEELFEYLKKFLEAWNAQEDALKLNKIRFGSAEIDVPAHYYYYRDGKNESNSFAVNGAIKAYIEFSAVLSFAGAPAEMLARDLVYLPYASYVHEHNSGFFVPESEKPNNVYQFELPQKIYTYNSLGQNNG